jgi:hypothetical protein
MRESAGSSATATTRSNPTRLSAVQCPTSSASHPTARPEVPARACRHHVRRSCPRRVLLRPVLLCSATTTWPRRPSIYPSSAPLEEDAPLRTSAARPNGVVRRHQGDGPMAGRPRICPADRSALSRLVDNGSTGTPAESRSSHRHTPNQDDERVSRVARASRSAGGMVAGGAGRSRLEEMVLGPGIAPSGPAPATSGCLRGRACRISKRPPLPSRFPVQRTVRLIAALPRSAGPGPASQGAQGSLVCVRGDRRAGLLARQRRQPRRCHTAVFRICLFAGSRSRCSRPRLMS